VEFKGKVHTSTVSCQYDLDQKKVIDLAVKPND
jgi:hypothetical protein